MELPVTVAPSLAPPAAASRRAGPGAERPDRQRPWPGAALGTVALAAIGWVAVRGSGARPDPDLTYALGVAGGSMMLVLLLYPLRKRLPLLRRLGALTHWFRLHMVCGICGPSLIVLHSGFHAGSLNAMVALSCMVLVVLSGLVGRFLYRQIHRGLYGRRATLRAAEEALARDLAALQPQAHDFPAVQAAIGRFRERAAHRPRTAAGRALHFVTLGSRRRQALWHVQCASAAATRHGARDAGEQARLARLVATADHTLVSLQRAAQFAAYERLFALWHVLHVPFVYLLGASAVVHVVAVHAY
jgi:hypothetical protein